MRVPLDIGTISDVKAAYKKNGLMARLRLEHPDRNREGQWCRSQIENEIGPIAQLRLERTPDKREVSGSTPLRPTDANRGYSSVGRAPGLQPGGHRFDPG